MSSISGNSASHWDAYWAAAEGRSGEHPFGGSGEAPGDLFDEVWREFLAGALVGREAPFLLDLACGAGAVLDRALQLLAASPARGAQLCGLDYAVSAASAMACKSLQHGATVHGVAASAAAIPIHDGAVDILVSQFGIEYAGVEAFGDAARILAPDGVAQIIIHYKGGGIDRECAENMRILGAILSHGLFETADDLVRGADNGGDLARLDEAVASLKPYLEGEPRAARQMLARLLSDVSTLVTRRKAYRQSEAIGWLEAMCREVELYAGRMRAMTECALDAGAIVEARRRLSSHGAEVAPPQVLTTKSGDAPVAWLICASAKQ